MFLSLTEHLQVARTIGAHGLGSMRSAATRPTRPARSVATCAPVASKVRSRNRPTSKGIANGGAYATAGPSGSASATTRTAT